LNEINRAISQRIFKIQNDVAKKERDRLSKEIHDKAGYIFINLIMMLQAASSLINKDLEKTEKLIKDARNYAERGINEIRYLLRDIRNFSPVKMSLQNELYDLAVSFQEATEVEIEMDYGVWPKTISENIDSFFISFMQESLTNALKHGKATKISCCCWTDETCIGMSVADNGIGTKEPIYKGIGIAAMEDVADQFDGFIRIKTSDRDGGFKITAAVSRRFFI
jgi:signal transduction histidine kinase